MKWVLWLLALSLLVTTCSGDSIVYVRVHRPLIDAHLSLAPQSEADRIHTVHSLFQKGGCPQIMEQSVPQQDFPNVICLLPGSEEGTLVVSASSDYGQDDPSGWSTLAMLPLLVESFAQVPHRFTIAVVAFTGRDHHLRGASWYVEHLSDDQRKNIRALVDLDNLGRTPAVYALAQKDRTLGTWLEVAAHSLQFPTPALMEPSTFSTPLVNGQFSVREEDLWANAKPFEHEHVPSITVQSASAAALPTLQRAAAVPADVTGKEFNPDTYENTYRLLAVYLLYLDRNLGRPLVEAGVYQAKIVDTSGVFTSSPVDLAVQIDRIATVGQLNRFELLLQKGQDALADALGDETDAGSLRLGTDLAQGVKLISMQNSGESSKLFLVAVRPRSQGAVLAPRSRGGRGGGSGSGPTQNYRFSVVKLSLARDGRGDGEYYSSAKLSFNKKHELEVEDFGSKPDPVVQLHFVPPAKVAPGTAVAEATSAPTGPTVAASKPAAATASGATAAPTVVSASAASAPPPPSQPVFRAKAQLVLVDVTAIDGSGKPVEGLKQSDFSIFEDGKPQEIRAFETHVPAAGKPAPAPTSAAAAALPPHTYTNRVVAPADDSLNIFLLDLLNTPVADQAFARKQAIQFLKNLPAGKRIAMFVLGDHLVMVQEFTQDSSTLVAAAQKVMNDPSLVLTTEAQRQEFQGSTDTVGRVATPGVTAVGAPAGSLSNIATGGDIDFGSAQARERSNAMVEADRTAQRVQITLDALTGLSRSVSAYPGRKNLVWLSGGFPIRLGAAGIDFFRLNSANGSRTTGLVGTTDFRPLIRETTTALSVARIAVYPIDVRGVLTSGVDISIGAADSASFTGTDNPSAYRDNLNIQSETRFQERSSMVQVAVETGGAVIGGNDVRLAIAKGLEGGSSYYTIAYSPSNDDTGPDFRKVTVKTNRSDLKLGYRPGYFPAGRTDNPAQKVHPLIVAMQPGSLPSTVIPLTVEVLPPDSPGSKTRINYSIDISGIDFAEAANHARHAVLDCIAVAFSKVGQPVGQISNTVDVSLPPADYDAALKSGFAVHQELDLPPGNYILRLGVMDHASQKIGTLDLPLAVTSVSAAK
jgi:VWFA-related protein